MSIDVLWEEMRWGNDPKEPGQSHLLAALRDERSQVERFLRSSAVTDLPNLRFISHETITVFHQQHLPPLLKELEALCEQDHEPEVEKHLCSMLDFIRRAHGKKNTHITFQPR